MQGLFGLERLPEIYGLAGATLTLALLSFPYMLLTVRASLSNLDPATEESARGLGCGPLGTLWRVTLPQLRPSIASGGLLVALYTLSDFGAVSLMRYQTFTWVIYQQYESAYDRSVAAVLSLGLVAMAAVVLVLVHVSQGRERYYQSNAAAARVPRRFRLGRWKWPSVDLLRWRGAGLAGTADGCAGLLACTRPGPWRATSAAGGGHTQLRGGVGPGGSCHCHVRDSGGGRGGAPQEQAEPRA